MVVISLQENYVPSSSDGLSKQRPIYDMILCLSLTKWIHLNWGDQGLKLMFKRIFMNLHPGGRLILEPQPFSSYKKKRNLTVSVYHRKLIRQLQNSNDLFLSGKFFFILSVLRMSSPACLITITWGGWLITSCGFSTLNENTALLFESSPVLFFPWIRSLVQ